LENLSNRGKENGDYKTKSCSSKKYQEGVGRREKEPHFAPFAQGNSDRIKQASGQSSQREEKRVVRRERHE
jgi:hypothetical protein